MKRVATPGAYSNRDEWPAKLRRRRDTLPTPSNKQQLEQSTLQPPSPLSNNNCTRVDKPDRKPDTTPQSTTVNERKNEIFEWIPPPSLDFEVMSQPASKRSRSISTHRGRPRSISPSTSASSREAKSNAYKAANYVTILETKGCFMRSSDAGPTSDDVDLCQRLLDPSTDPPRETLFDDEFIEDFHNTLRNRSEARLLIDLHPLLMPSAENLFIQGREELENVTDGYNDPWLKTEPIYGPKPQPDHARGLKWSIFSESQRRKLGWKPDEKSLYAVREDMYFPYLTAEIECGNQALEFADRQNMHSMCIALRAVVSLAQAAGRPEAVHRRLLGFSISHELEVVRIYGYYPEVVEGGIRYYRWSLRQFSIWTEADKWACYRFVENLDRDFLPAHIERIMHFLEEIIDPQDEPLELLDDDIGSQSQIGSQARPSYSRTTSSQRGLQPELRNMIQALQQQLEEQRAEQKAREEKLLDQLERQRLQMEQQRAEQKAREEKLLVQLEQQRLQMEQQRAEQKEREEKLLVQLEQQRLQMEQQRAEQKAREEHQKSREERLLTLLERRSGENAKQ